MWLGAEQAHGGQAPDPGLLPLHSLQDKKSNSGNEGYRTHATHCWLVLALCVKGISSRTQAQALACS